MLFDRRFWGVANSRRQAEHRPREWINSTRDRAFAPAIR